MTRNSFKEIGGLLSTYKFYWSGTFPHRYKAFDLTLGVNKALAKWLETEGFFRFHITNVKRRVVYYHQIIAFMFCGGKEALSNGFTCSQHSQEIHHLDGNTSNNYPSNLIYLTSEVHSVITGHQRSLKKYLKKFKKGTLDNPPSIWNRKGNRIIRWWDWVAMILIKTISSTAKSLRIPLLLKEFGNWIGRIIKRLKVGVDSTFVPTFIINYAEEQC